MIEYIGIPSSTFKLLFRASRDGGNAEAFNRKCNNKGPTLIIIKSKVHGKIFGGFTPCVWGSQDGYINDPE